MLSENCQSPRNFFVFCLILDLAARDINAPILAIKRRQWNIVVIINDDSVEVYIVHITCTYNILKSNPMLENRIRR